ncbi:MAG: hypothetical protein J4F42_03610 [Desulfurellaceae bacterium]|nr:hypothetical protein [Desulfurellaceae bacterium]
MLVTNLAKVAQLFVSKAVWNVTGLDVAGRTLIHALDSEDENIRTIAGIFLVQTGQRAEPLLEEALHKGQYLPMVINVLGSIGDPRIVSELRPFTEDSDPEIARAAQDAIQAIDFASQSGPSGRDQDA